MDCMGLPSTVAQSISGFVGLRICVGSALDVVVFSSDDKLSTNTLRSKDDKNINSMPGILSIGLYKLLLYFFHLN